MPGNKKSKRVKAKETKKFISKVLITIWCDGKCEVLTAASSPQNSFLAFRAALTTAATKGEFDSVMPLWKQVRTLKRDMLRCRPWWYRALCLFI